MRVRRSYTALLTLLLSWYATESAHAGPPAKNASHRSDQEIQLAPSSKRSLLPPELSVRAPFLSPPPREVPAVPLLDLQLIATGVVTTFAPYIVTAPAGPEVSAPLSRHRINPIDRLAASLRWGPAEAISDVLLSSAIVLPHLANLVDTLFGQPDSNWHRFGAESLMLVEAFTLSGMVANVVKFAVRRPRPYAYISETTTEELAARETTLSFFSGHTAIAFSMASCYSYLFTTRHPQSSFAAPVWLGTHALAGLTGMMRVLASKHFTTDVLTGAAVGSTVGLLVPLLHDNASRWFGEHASGLRLVPLIERGGIGITAMRAW